MSTARFHITGTAPLIHNSSRSADPLHPDAIALKRLLDERKPKDRTPADYVVIGKKEFTVALYVDEDGEPCLTADMIMANIINGAKKTKAGKDAQVAIIVKKGAKLIYDGPKDLEGLLADPKFHFRTMHKVQSNRVPKTRPIFNKWEAEIEVEYDENVVDATTVEKWLRAGGNFAGFGDWRPRHGTFTVKAL